MILILICSPSSVLLSFNPYSSKLSPPVHQYISSEVGNIDPLCHLPNVSDKNDNDDGDEHGDDDGNDDSGSDDGDDENKDVCCIPLKVLSTQATLVQTANNNNIVQRKTWIITLLTIATHLFDCYVNLFYKTTNTLTR